MHFNRLLLKDVNMIVFLGSIFLIITLVLFGCSAFQGNPDQIIHQLKLVPISLSDEKDLGQTNSVEIDEQGNFYLFDIDNSYISKYDSSGRKIWSTGGRGDKEGTFRLQSSNITDHLIIGKDGYLYASDSGNKRIQVFSTDGRYIRNYRIPWVPEFFDVSEDGTLYVFQYNHISGDTIFLFDNDGRLGRSFAKQLFLNYQTKFINRSKIIYSGGKIYTFSRYYPIVQIIDKSGEKIEVINYSYLLPKTWLAELVYSSKIRIEELCNPYKMDNTRLSLNRYLFLLDVNINNNNWLVLMNRGKVLDYDGIKGKKLLMELKINENDLGFISIRKKNNEYYFANFKRPTTKILYRASVPR